MKKYWLGILAAVAAIFAMVFSRREEEEPAVEALEKKISKSDGEMGAKLMAVQTLTKSAKEDYDRAMADLPPDYKPPTGGERS